jgi:hypothetical protein
MELTGSLVPAAEMLEDIGIELDIQEKAGTSRKPAHKIVRLVQGKNEIASGSGGSIRVAFARSLHAVLSGLSIGNMPSEEDMGEDSVDTPAKQSAEAVRIFALALATVICPETTAVDVEEYLFDNEESDKEEDVPDTDDVGEEG